MDLTHIEHLGIAVRNLDDAIPFWEKLLNTKCYKIEEVAEQKVKTAFLKIGETKIELLEPTAEDSPVAKFIENRGEGVHHVAFATSDIVGNIKESEELGIRMIDKAPRKGADGMNIAFLHPKSTSGVLVEFCQKGEE